MMPRAHKADELQDHDQRARRRFCQTESVHHLSGFNPAVIHRLLATYGSTAYAPPKVTTAALLKNRPCLNSVLSQPRREPAISIGVNHRVSHRIETRNARVRLGRVCGGDSCSSLM